MGNVKTLLQLRSKSIGNCVKKDLFFYKDFLCVTKTLIRQKVGKVNFLNVLRKNATRFFYLIFFASPIAYMQFSAMFCYYSFVYLNKFYYYSFLLLLKGVGGTRLFNYTLLTFLFSINVRKTYNYPLNLESLIQSRKLFSALVGSLDKGIQNRYFDLFFNYLPAFQQVLVAQHAKLYSAPEVPLLPSDPLWKEKGIDFNIYLSKFVTKTLKKGKKSKAIKLVFEFLFFYKLHNLSASQPRAFGDILSFIAPKFKLVNIKYRGRNRQVPKLVSTSKFMVLGLTSLLLSLKSRSEKNFVHKLFNEVIDINAFKGNALRLKEANYKVGVLNRQLLFRRSSNWKARKVYDFKQSQYYLG